MSMLIFSAFLLGAALGMRFKVFILIPVAAFALIAIVAASIAHGNSVSGTLIAGVLTLCCLQIGYISGVVTRYSLTQARAERQRKASLQVESAR